MHLKTNHGVLMPTELTSALKQITTDYFLICWKILRVKFPKTLSLFASEGAKAACILRTFICTAGIDYSKKVLV
jgi:hypothetical protein